MLPFFRSFRRVCEACFHQASLHQSEVCQTLNLTHTSDRTRNTPSISAVKLHGHARLNLIGVSRGQTTGLLAAALRATQPVRDWSLASDLYTRPTGQRSNEATQKTILKKTRKSL